MEQSTHKLTKAEQRRLDNFVRIKEDLESRGYKCTELLIKMAWANIFAAILFVLATVAEVLYYDHPTEAGGIIFEKISDGGNV